MADAGPLDEPPRRAVRKLASGGGRQEPRDLWDPGAQPERTYQAWTRTALAFTVCALLATRLVGDAAVLAIGVSLVAAVVAIGIVRMQKHRLHSAVIRPSPWSVLTMALMTVLLAAVAFVLLLVAA